MVNKLQKISFLGIFVLLLFLPKNILAQDSEMEASPEASMEQDVQAAEQKNEFYKGQVLEILEEGNGGDLGYDLPTQKVKVKILDGPEKGKEIETEHGSYFAIREDQKVKAGDKVVVVKAHDTSGDIYVITDSYRVEPMLILFLVLAVLAFVVGGRSVLKLFALGGISLFAVIKFMIPQIVESKDPLMLTAIASVIFAAILIFSLEGLGKKSIVLLSSFILIVLAAMYGIQYVADYVSISGYGSEEAVFLQIGPYAGIDLKNMLLGGFIFASAAPMVYLGRKQFKFIEKALAGRKKLTKKELAKKSVFEVGQLASTFYFLLAFAFIAASYPLFLLLNFNQDVPMWVALNSEYFAEEIVRLIVVGVMIYGSVIVNAILGTYFLVSDKKKK